VDVELTVSAEAIAGKLEAARDGGEQRSVSMSMDDGEMKMPNLSCRS